MLQFLCTLELKICNINLGDVGSSNVLKYLMDFVFLLLRENVTSWRSFWSDLGRSGSPSKTVETY